MKINIPKIKAMQGFQICPFCGGKTEYAGIISGHIFPAIHTGQMYICIECGYQGSFIIDVVEMVLESNSVYTGCRVDNSIYRAFNHDFLI